MDFTPLQTERLTLRLHARSDIPALMPVIGAGEVASTTLRIPHPYAEADAQDFIAGTQEELLNGSGLRLGIVLRESDTLCGGVGLRIESDHRRAELGYWIGVPYWGKGYATEAAMALVQYGFETLGLYRIFASHFPHNLASARSLRKIGMRHEGSQAVPNRMRRISGKILRAIWRCNFCAWWRTRRSSRRAPWAKGTVR